MEKRKNKNDAVRAILISAGFIASAVLLFFLGRAAMRMYERYDETAKNLNRSKTEVIMLKERQSALISDIDGLKTEEGIEKEIRENYRMHKEGEKLIVIMGDKMESESGEIKTDKPWWKNFFDFFKRN